MSKNSIFGAITKILSAVGLNAVPAVGFLGLGWGWENTLLIYLLETLIGGLLAVLRIRLLAPAHEEVMGATIPNPWGKSKQVISYARPMHNGVRYDRNEMLMSYLLIIVIFFVVVGALVIGFLLLIMRVQLNLEALRNGLIGILMFQLLNLLGDVAWLRMLSLPESEKLLRIVT